MDELIFVSLSRTHYWYEVGMLKVPTHTFHATGDLCGDELIVWRPFDPSTSCLHFRPAFGMTKPNQTNSSPRRSRGTHSTQQYCTPHQANPGGVLCVTKPFHMAIHVSVQHNSGFLPDIILLTYATTNQEHKYTVYQVQNWRPFGPSISCLHFRLRLARPNQLKPILLPADPAGLTLHNSTALPIKLTWVQYYV